MGEPEDEDGGDRGEEKREEDLVEVLPHYYRGEMARTTNALDRIDKTTNWAITLIAALITVVFSSRGMPARLLWVGFVILAMFLAFEVRRYRFYDLYRSRVRLLQEHLFADLLDPRAGGGASWRSMLAEDLRDQAFKVTRWEALARRIERIYGFLFALVAVAWLAKTIFFSSVPWGEAASLFGMPGEIVTGALVGGLVGMGVFAWWPRKREAKGEIQEVDPGRWKEE